MARGWCIAEFPWRVGPVATAQGIGLTAAAVGDDALQKQSQGYVVPDSVTHGSPEQRVRWFRRGYGSGNPTTCDTFAAKTL